MTSEPSTDADREPTAGGDGETRLQRAASEAAALVAEQVRDALAVAERSAENVRQQARDEASAQRDAVHTTADQVLARIDELEDRLARLLRELRDAAMQVRRTVESPSGSEPAAQPPGDSREAEPSGGEDGETRLGPGTGRESGQVPDAEREGADQRGPEDGTGVEQREEALSSPGALEDSAASAPEAAGAGAPTEGDALPGSVPAETRAEEVASTAEPASGPTAAQEPPPAEGESAPAAESVTGEVVDDHAETTEQTTDEPIPRPTWTDAPEPSHEGDDEPATVVRRRRRGLFRHRRDE